MRVVGARWREVREKSAPEEAPREGKHETDDA